MTNRHSPEAFAVIIVFVICMLIFLVGMLECYWGPRDIHASIHTMLAGLGFFHFSCFAYFFYRLWGKRAVKNYGEKRKARKQRKGIDIDKK